MSDQRPAKNNAPIRILHCHSTFNLGGKEARAVQLMNAFGDRAVHTILSAEQGAFGAKVAIDPHIKADFPTDAPSLLGKPEISRYREIVRYLRNFDLILTYNWAAMDVVAARRLFGRGSPPLIHHEDGFNADEAVKLNWKRNWFRRLMLPGADELIVPSQLLQGIARTIWKRDAVRIPNGIDVEAFARPPAKDAIPGFARREGEVIIGAVAGLRPVKNLPRLVRAVAPIANARLVIVGQGPEREAIMAEAERCGMAGRLIMPGFLKNPANYVGLFDIFCLSSESEQFPISLVEAMAAGLPAVSTNVGDVMNIVSDENRFAVTNDEADYAAALRLLCDDPALRRSVGAANRVRARAEFDELMMIARYAELYVIAG